MMKKARVEDAETPRDPRAVEKASCRAAAFGHPGIVPCSTLGRLRERFGVSIVKRAIYEPLALDASNAGHEGAVFLGRTMLKSGKGATASTR